MKSSNIYFGLNYRPIWKKSITKEAFLVGYRNIEIESSLLIREKIRELPNSRRVFSDFGLLLKFCLLIREFSISYFLLEPINRESRTSIYCLE